MRGTQYQCPYCAQTSSRRWNMKIHIERRHNGRVAQEQARSGLVDSSSVFSGQEQREKDSFSKMRDEIRDMHETMRQIAEIRSMSNQFQSSSYYSFPQDQLYNAMSSFNTQQSHETNAKLSRITDWYTSLAILDNLFRTNKNIGLRGYICNNCFDCWVHPVYTNSGEMISLLKSIKPSPHTCNPEKVADLQTNIQNSRSKKCESENTLINVLVVLITALCSYLPRNKIRLKTEELMISPAYPSAKSTDIPGQDRAYSPHLHEDKKEEQKQHQDAPMSFGTQTEELNCNSVDIDLYNVEKSHWTYRAISETRDNGKSTIVMDASELVDFVNVVKGSYGILRCYIDGSVQHFFIYLSFKDN
jgi:hypothetical protein